MVRQVTFGCTDDCSPDPYLPGGKFAEGATLEVPHATHTHTHTLYKLSLLYSPLFSLLTKLLLTKPLTCDFMTLFARS